MSAESPPESRSAPGVTGGQAAVGQVVRRHNLALALTMIADSVEPLSRAGLAAATGMTRATAGSLVDQLIGAGLVVEVARQSPSAAGRPATGLRLDGRGLSGLGLEVNVDYLAATLLDADGRTRYREVVTQDQRDVPPAEVFDRLGRLAARAMAVAGTGPLAGAAVAVPGLVDAGTGLLRSAPNLGWSDVAALEVIGRVPTLAGVPLRLGNEADYSALAELFGPRPPAGDFLFISGEIGIGAGIVVGGRPWTGRHGWGGEIGHVTVEADGPACACGSRGCLEQYAGQEAILRAVRAADPAGRTEPADPLEVASARTMAGLLEAARGGDPATVSALRAAGDALGIVVAGVLNILDIPEVVLGGIYGSLAPWLGPALRDQLDRRVVWSRWLEPVVTVSSQRPGAACHGAAASVVREVVADPAAWLDRQNERSATAK